MDFSDQGTQTEFLEREVAIQAAGRSINPAIKAKREKLLEAREIAAQHGANASEVQALSLTCHNDCGEPLTVENDDIFCCKECAEDWQRRERARQIAGR